MKSILTGIICVLVCLEGFTQFSYAKGFEIGYAFSDKNMETAFFTSDGIVYEKYEFKPSLVVGISGELILKRWIYFSAAVQYQKKQENYSFNREINNYFGAYTIDSRRDVTFHKLCAPFSFGLTHQFNHFRPSIFVGYRLNKLFSGRHYEKSDYTYINPTDNYTSELEFDPLEGHKIIATQFFFGFSVQFRNQLQISASINKGYVTYSQGNFPLNCEAFGIRNNDYILSVTYFLRNKYIHCNLKIDKSRSVRFL